MTTTKPNFDDRLASLLEGFYPHLGCGEECGNRPFEELDQLEKIAKIKAEIASQMPKREIIAQQFCSICKTHISQCTCRQALRQVEEALQKRHYSWREKMRDPNRIKIIIDKLEEAWKLVPDWRLGQLVSNLQGTGVQDVFYLEDSEWEKRIDNFIESESPKETLSAKDSGGNEK